MNSSKNKSAESLLAIANKGLCKEELASLYEAILNNASYAMIATDVDGIIVLFNPAAEQMLGFSAQELVGQKTPAIWHDPLEVELRAEQFSRQFSKKIEPGFEVFVAKTKMGLPNQQEWTYIKKDGSRITVMLAITALYNRKKKITGFLGIASDLSMQQQMQKELQAARDELAIAIELSQLGVWSWNPTTNALYWNKRMFEIYQQPLALREKGLTYEHWRMRLHPEDAKKTEKKLADAVRGISDYDIIFRIVQPSGQIRYIKGAAKISRDTRGDVLNVTGMNLDITTEIEHERLLLSEKERSDEANQAKSAFLANMSHEIRTPMNAIIGLLKLLRKTTLEPHQLDYVRLLESSGANLLAIINDILDFSKIESNKLVFDLHSVNLEKIFKDMAPILSIAIGNKDLELLFDFNINLPQCILADGLRLQQILLNLLSNAIKFTPRGEVIFGVHALERKKKTVKLQFCIRDTGVGIASEKLTLIFEAFTQAESDITRHFGGTGLGLAISRKLVQLMGGELYVESKLKQGSHFYFNLTFPIATPKQCAEITKLDYQPLSLKCLLVDDNASAQKIIGEMLRAFGWKVEAASSGMEAINKIVKNDISSPFDLVYIDYHMPDLDGWEICKGIRAQKLKSPLALILMSKVGDSNQIVQLKNDHPRIIDGYLPKPVTPSSLYDSAANIYLSTPSKEHLAKNSPIGVGRLNGLQILLVEDNLTNQVVAHDLLASEGASVSISEDSLHTLDQIEAADSLFDVVLMDIQMPGIDGYTLTKKIRKKYSKQQLPIIAMSANVEEESRRQAIHAGMNDFVGKPFRLDELVTTILQVKTKNNSTSVSAQVFDDAQAFDDNEALNRFGGNQEIYAHALSVFIQDVQELLNELPQTLTQHIDSKQLDRTLHTLKGLAGTVGVNALVKVVNEAYQKLKGNSLSNKDWVQYYSAMNTIGLDAIARAKKLLKNSELKSKKSRIDSKKVHLFKKLLPYLETNNMKAFELYTELKQQIGIDETLDAAIFRLDFQAAAARCRFLMKQNMTGGACKKAKKSQQ